MRCRQRGAPISLDKFRKGDTTLERVNKGAPSGRDYLQEDNIRRAQMGFTDPDDAEEFEVWFR